MIPLRARDALSDKVIRVRAEARPADIRADVRSQRATHAVIFEEEQFRGVLPLREIGFSCSERIFADLFDKFTPPQTVSAEASLDEVVQIFGAEACDSIVVVNGDCGYIGVITQQSLLHILLEWTRALSAVQAQTTKDRFHGLLESVLDAIIIVDHDGRIVQLNKNAAKMFGYDQNDLLDQVIERLIPAQLHEKHVKYREQHFTNPIARRMGERKPELIGLRKDGSKFPVEISLNSLTGEQSNCVVSVIRDISAQKQSEQELKRFRAAINISADAVVLIDRHKMRFVDVNDTACAKLGYSREELLRLGPQDVKPQSTKAELEHRYDEVIKSSLQTGVVETLHQRKDGSQFPAEVSMRALKLDENDFLIAVIRDITERKRAEKVIQASHRQLEKTLAELKQTQQQVIQQERLRAVGQLAGGVAHDLNNSLSPVLGYAEMLASASDLPETLRQWASLIEMGARDAAAVVERLRDFYRPEDENGGALRTVNLRELMTQIPQLTRPKWRDEAQRTGRNIEIELDLDASPLVHGNPSELREVLTNLVFNAVDAMPSGGKITLCLRSTHECAVIEVTDTGIGMINDVASRCFEPFFTAKGSESSGLGLSVCHGIVQRHSGQFEIDTLPGHGTTMQITLPLAVEDKLARLEEPLAVVLPSRKVLYIDDDPRLRQLASTLLEELGQEVDMAESGAAGLERFQKIEYDVVLTDLGMPGIDGREVTRIIKETRQHVPVIMVTGWGSKALHEQIGFAVEPDQLLSKPLTLAKLREALEKAFAQPEIAANSD